MEQLNYSISDEDTPRIKGLLKEFKPHDYAIYSLSISPDRKYIITGSADKTVKVWELESGNSFQILEGHELEVTSVNISSDGSRIVTGSEDKTVKLWKLETGNLLRNFTGHKGAIFGTLITPNDKYIISISEDKTAKIWNWFNKKLLRSLEGHEYSINSVDITPDGKFIATSGEKSIKIWKWGTKEPAFSLEGHNFPIRSIAIGSKGDYLVSGSYDKLIKIWNLESKELINTFEGHKGSINSVALSDDRQYIASGSGDKSLIVWNFNDGYKYGPFPHDTYVQCVKFIPNSHLVVSGDFNGIIRVWDFLEEYMDISSALNSKEEHNKIKAKPQKKLTVFISYATLDSEKFQIPKIAKLLSRSYPEIGAVLYWEEYMDDDIYVYMNDNLALADVVLVFCSENANKSEAVRTEWMAAHKMKKKIIPIFENENDIPPLLTTKLGICIESDDLKDFITNLYSLIQKKMKKAEKRI
ncbi:MAG: TIR domain-containing protein [Promethearchaeota archaeon]